MLLGRLLWEPGVTRRLTLFGLQINSRLADTSLSEICNCWDPLLGQFSLKLLRYTSLTMKRGVIWKQTQNLGKLQLSLAAPAPLKLCS